MSTISFFLLIGASFWMAMTQIVDDAEYSALMSIYSAIGSLTHNLSASLSCVFSDSPLVPPRMRQYDMSSNGTGIILCWSCDLCFWLRDTIVHQVAFFFVAQTHVIALADD